MSTNDIGSNYATALLDALDSPEAIARGGRELEFFATLVGQLPSLGRLLDNPGLVAQKRHALLDEALAKLDPHPMIRKFLHLMVDNERTRQVREVWHSFQSLRDRRLGVTRAEVATAVALDAKSRAEWEKQIARLTGGKVDVAFRTDASLIGGALTRVGSVVYDGTLRKQLETIRGDLLSRDPSQTETRR